MLLAQPLSGQELVALAEISFNPCLLVSPLLEVGRDKDHPMLGQSP